MHREVAGRCKKVDGAVQERSELREELRRK